MKTKEQEEADAAFIEKIKTLAVHTAKKIENGEVHTLPPCLDCGTPMKLVAVAIVKRRPHERRESEEQSFSA